MTRRAVVVLAVLACALLAAVPVAAHTNDVRADPQASPDGTLVVESVFAGTDGFLAVQRDDGGDPGAVVGHVAVDAGDGFVTDVRVDVDESAWQTWDGTETVHLVLRQDDGDGTFEPSADPAVRSFGQTAEAVVPVTKGDRAVVTARGFGPQEARNGTVQVRRAVLPTDGHLVVRNATSGRVLGTATLDAGDHRNVTVPLDRAAGEQFRAQAVLYRDDGDGAFGDGDEPLTVGGEQVATLFAVEGGERATATNVTTATPTTESGSVVTTATPTATDRATTSEGTTTSGGQPGFGPGVAAVAVLTAWLWRRR